MSAHSGAQTDTIPKIAWFGVIKIHPCFFKSFKFASKAHLKSSNMSSDDYDKFKSPTKFAPAELQI